MGVFKCFLNFGLGIKSRLREKSNTIFCFARPHSSSSTLRAAGARHAQLYISPKLTELIGELHFGRVYSIAPSWKQLFGMIWAVFHFWYPASCKKRGGGVILYAWWNARRPQNSPGTLRFVIGWNWEQPVSTTPSPPPNFRVTLTVCIHQVCYISHVSTFK